MKPADIKAVRERWRSPSSRELALASSRWLAGAGPLPPALGTVDGRVDLRGLTFPDARTVGSFASGELSFQSIAGMPQFTGTTWRNVDLSAAVIRHARFLNARIEDCRFEHADLFDWRLWDSNVSGSSFVKADLKDSALGTPPNGGTGNRWVDVDFDGADLSGALFRQAVVHRATFRRAKLRKTKFGFCDLDSLSFEGLLDTTHFLAVGYQGQPQGTHWMRNIDFGDVLFRNGQIQGYRMRDVRLPSDVLLVPNLPDVVKRAETVAAMEEADIRHLVERARELTEMTPERCWDYVFFPSDFVQHGRESVGQRLRAVYERALQDMPHASCD